MNRFTEVTIIIDLHVKFCYFLNNQFKLLEGFKNMFTAVNVFILKFPLIYHTYHLEEQLKEKEGRNKKIKLNQKPSIAVMVKLQG